MAPPLQPEALDPEALDLEAVDPEVVDSSALPGLSLLPAHSSRSMFFWSNLCTLTEMPWITWTGPSFKICCTASSLVITMRPRFPGLVLGSITSPTDFTLECATITWATSPYFEKCLSNSTRERKPSWLVLRATKTSLGFSCRRSCRNERNVLRGGPGLRVTAAVVHGRVCSCICCSCCSCRLWSICSCCSLCSCSSCSWCCCCCCC
mmetsp:Transcript_59386/g.117683  ORF Transcript_59386/g.117683 Transcript_59386/m.117683 type:complete len:207 (-) Transcript_59386:340-960(-)